MKNFYLLTYLTILLSYGTSNAQNIYQPGHAILNDGTKISGEISFYENSPWLNQRFIFIKDSADLAQTGTKAKAKKYKADDLKSYQVAGRTYEKVNYIDLQNIQVKSLGSNNHMLEQFSSGRINAYRFYAYPKDIEVYINTSSEVIKENQQRDKDALLAGWKLLTQKDGGSFKNSFEYDFQKFFEDAPEITQKYKNGSYGNTPISNKKGLAGKMVTMAMKASLQPLEYQSIIAAFNDYNKKFASNQ